MGLVKWTRGLRDLLVGERERSISLVGERAYVQFRGVSSEALPAFQAALTEYSAAHPELSSVHINPFTRRVVFQASGKSPGRSLLEGLVRAAESAVQADPRAYRLDRERDLPDDLSLDREYSLEALADASWMLCRLEESTSARQRAYAGYLEAHEEGPAARTAWRPGAVIAWARSSGSWLRWPRPMRLVCITWRPRSGSGLPRW